MATAKKTTAKAADMFTAFQDNEAMAALSESSTALAEGIKEIGAAAMTFATDNMKTSAEAAKAVTGAASIQEAFEVQTGFAKQAMSQYMEQTGAMTTLMSEAFMGAFVPLQAQAGKVVETFGVSK